MLVLHQCQESISSQADLRCIWGGGERIPYNEINILLDPEITSTSSQKTRNAFSLVFLSFLMIKQSDFILFITSPKGHWVIY